MYRMLLRGQINWALGLSNWFRNMEVFFFFFLTILKNPSILWRQSVVKVNYSGQAQWRCSMETHSSGGCGYE